MIMKFKTIVMAFLSLFIAMTSCSQSKSETVSNQNSKENNKILVAYFSATGTTRGVAQKLANVMDATLFEIEPAVPYTEADLDWRDKTSRSTLEMQDSTSRPAIKNKVTDIEQYDVVFLGYPVWWYVAPTIINTFIDENNLAGKKVYCFATSGGSPIGPCVDALKKQYPGIDWQEGKLLNNATLENLQSWKKEISL